MAANKRKPVPKKSTVKTKKSRVIVSKPSKYSRSWPSFRVIALFVVIFAAIGSYFLYKSFADNPSNYLVGMGSAGAIAASQDANGNVTMSGPGAAQGFQIASDNSLQCTNGDGGNITTAQLTPQQTSDVANRVIAAGIQSQSDTVLAKGQGALEGTWVTVNTNGVNKTVNIIGNAQSTAFGRAVADVAKDVCKQAKKTLKATEAMSPSGKKLTKAEGQSIARKIEDAINAKAYADSGFNTRFETAQYVGINWWRDHNGVTKNLKFAACLQSSARIHSQRMAAVDTMSHQLPGEPVFTTRINNNCPSNWVYAGENIAWNSDVSLNGVALLEDLMATEAYPPPNHRSNILSTHYDYVGAGAYYCDKCGNDGNSRVYITNDFASFNNPVPTYDPVDDWNLNGKSTVSTTASGGGTTSVTVRPGQTVYYHYSIVNTGPKWASFTQYRTWKHYNPNGTLANSSDEHAESSNGIGWGKHGDGWSATPGQQYAFNGRYYDDYTADSGAVVIPSTAKTGEKYCRLVHYTNATGPSTGAQNSNEACAVVKV